jgi:hypothetical protein
MGPVRMLPFGNARSIVMSDPPSPSGKPVAARVLLCGSMLGLSWLGLQAVHELGHAAVAWATGGEVQRVVLHPLTISRTDVAPNPQPLIVTWAGPLLGVMLPLLAWGVAAVCRARWAYLLRSFAGASCVANGAYIGAGAFAPVGDAATLRQLGAPAWLLAVFGVTTIVAGLACWHGQGRHFGFRGATVNSRHALVVTGLWIASVAVLVWIGSR